MNLRVLRSAGGSLAVEVSSPDMPSEFKWLVPLLPVDSEMLENINPVELVKVAYDNEVFFVPFLLIRTVQLVEVRSMIDGTLSLEDSINILNNIYDRLAYDHK